MLTGSGSANVSELKPDVRLSRYELPVVGLCFLLSGFAALVYETAWGQQLTLVFGTSELAIAAVLAAYMAGLAIGSAVMARYIQKIQRPLLVYAVLELGIALAALLVPQLSAAMNQLQGALLGVSELSSYSPFNSAAFYLFSAFVILLLPTCLMGATLPLLVKYLVRKDQQIGSRVGLLYMINTVGAAAGALVTAFVLLPGLGLGKTTWVAVSVNLLAFLLAAAWSKAIPISIGGADGVQPGSGSRPSRSMNQWILPVIMVSGFVSLSYEVLWVRLLSHILGGSIYAFGTMLAIFLLGLALGAGLAGRLAGSVERARAGFIWAQFGIALTFALAYLFADRLPTASLNTDFGSADFVLFSLWVGVLSLLPGSLFIGATFPFAVRLYAGSSQQVGSGSAKVYAWNTVGAIFGAVACGFVLLPMLEVAGTARFLLFCSLSLALFSGVLVKPIKRMPGVIAVAAIVLLTWAPLETPWKLLRTSPLAGTTMDGEIGFYREGRGATVMLTESIGDWRLTTNGLPESAIQRRGARVSRYSLARWLSMLPVVARPQAQKMLVIGFGAGITVASVPASVASIDVVELEPEVIEANQSYAEWREEDPLADPRVTIHINDARSALQSAGETFDLIVSQPSHPWTSAASHLFTREFFALVEQRLTEEGVFVQWIGARFIDEPLLRSLMATLHTSFPFVELYQPGSGGGLVFMASKQPLNMDGQLADKLPAQERWELMGIQSRAELLISRRLDAQGSKEFAHGAAVSSDLNNLMQMRSPRAMARSFGSNGPEGILAAYDPMVGVTDQRQDLFIIRRLIRENALQRARNLALQIRDPLMQQTAQELVRLTLPKQREAARQSLFQLLQQHPGNTEVLSALLLVQIQSVLEKTASPLLQQSAQQEPVARLLIEGLVKLRLNDVAGVRQLDDNLAQVAVSHPLYAAAARLRVAWRQRAGDPDSSRQAIRLLDMLLAVQVQPGQILQRANLAISADDTDSSVASLYELKNMLSRRPQLRRQLAATTDRLLNELEETGKISAAQRLELTVSQPVVAPINGS